MMETTTTVRPLREVAAEIRQDWGDRVWYGAEPYLGAMAEMDWIVGRYDKETGEDIVTRFLWNAAKWRGDVARRVKAELKARLKAERWRCEVVTGDDQTWAANAHLFETHDQALDYGTELFGRWMAPRPRWRAVLDSTPGRQPYEAGTEERSWS
jgi:hypothetical protein